MARNKPKKEKLRLKDLRPATREDVAELSEANKWLNWVENIKPKRDE
ncbi:MAG: hypothetical protein HC836_38485 [Richelia sp. RM2_1_2]|nr:hypothetical protein [Richelia sp. RM2_1_2]